MNLELSFQDVMILKHMCTAWLAHLEHLKNTAAKRGHEMAAMNADSDIVAVKNILLRLSNQPSEAEKVDVPRPQFKLTGRIIDIG